MHAITESIDDTQVDNIPAEEATFIERLEVSERNEAIQICIDKLPSVSAKPFIGLGTKTSNFVMWLKT